MAADNTNAAAYSNALAPCSNNGMIAIYSTLTKAEAFEANDTLTMCKVPAGYKVVAFAVHFDKKIGDATSTFKIGTQSASVTLDDDSLIGATAAAAAVYVVGPALTPTEYTTESSVVITIAAVGANASTDATVRLVVWATPFAV